MNELGLMLAKGIPNVVDKDPKKSVEYFKEAAEQGYIPAKYALGECYLEAKGVPKDEKEGLRLLREAAAAKDERAMNKLGAYLARAEDPRPVSARKEELDEAFRVLSEAKDMGYTDALANLAAMYLNGYVPGPRGADPNKEGAKLFAEGAKKGSVFCMAGYARCLETGTGTKANQLEAGNWYVKAAREGFKPAIDWCRAHPALAPGFLPPP